MSSDSPKIIESSGLKLMNFIISAPEPVPGLLSTILNLDPDPFDRFFLKKMGLIGKPKTTAAPAATAKV
jgi:hypothetical protein